MAIDHRRRGLVRRRPDHCVPGVVDELENAKPSRSPFTSIARRFDVSGSTSVADTVVFVHIAPDSDLDVLLAPLTPRADSAPDDVRLFNRRSAMLVVGGAGLTALLAACGSSNRLSSATTAAPSVTTATTAATATPVSVVLAPEMTECPYYLDLNLVAPMSPKTAKAHPSRSTSPLST